MAKTSSGILRLVSKRLPGQRDLAARARQLHLELAALVGEHDEAALGAGHLDGGVEHERQHFVEHAARAERAQALEQRWPAGGCRRPRSADAGRRAPAGRILDQEDDVGARRRGRTESDRRGVSGALGDLLAVDERAVARAAIAQHVGAVDLRDLGVIARDVAAGQPQVVLAAAADRDERLVDRDDAAAEPVVDFEACA